MKKEQKNVSLATEIIGNLQDRIDTVSIEIEGCTLDLARASFVLDELLELTEKRPENGKEALEFAENQDRIYKYADIAFNYVARVSSTLHDIGITIQREQEGDENA